MILLAITALPGCSSDDDSHGGSAAATPTNRYALLSDEGWTLQEAVDLAPEDPMSSIEQPALDWYAEFVDNSTTHGRMIRISGHVATLDEAAAELERKGYSFTSVNVAGWRAIAGSSSLEETAPSVLLLAHDHASVVLLSYELAVDELTIAAAELQLVDAAEWVASGGLIR